MKSRFLVLGVALSLAAGCVTMTDPVSMGDGRYMITLNARGGFQDNGKLLSQSIEKANAFCAQRDMQANVLNTKSTGVQMWTPQDNRVEFKCVPMPK